MSFPLLTLCILILLVFKDNIVRYIYLFQTLYVFANLCYLAPYELMIIGSNSNKNMSNFLANINILGSISTILIPIVSGFIISKFSYVPFFILLIIETVIIVLISFQIKDFTIYDKKLNMKEFWRKVKTHPHLHHIYHCMFFRKMSSQGAVLDLLPIILFLRLGTEFHLGAYSSLLALISIVSLQILKIINHKNMKKNFYPYFALLIFISSLFVLFHTSFPVLLLYYILMNSLGSIIESESCSYAYSSIKVDGLEKYKREHIIVFNIYMTAGQVISYILVFVLYHYFYNVNILSVAVSILMFFFIISTIYLKRVAAFERKIGM